MRIYLIIIILCGMTFTMQAQDVIVKKDGTKIEAKVLEISPTTVKYRNFTQLEGPDRTINISSLKEIIYEDGQFDDFSKVPESAQTPTPTTKPTPVTRVEKPVGPLFFKSGFFIDGIIGYANLTREGYYYGYTDPYSNPYGNTPNPPAVSKTSFLSIGFRIGTKWYFGQREKWRPGLQVNWVRLGMYLDPEDASSIIIGAKNFSIGNLGMANVFKINEKLALEVNFTTGINLGIDLDYERADIGISIAPEVKLRIGKLAVGFDYQRIQGFGTTDGPFRADRWNNFAISIGGKF